jgi:hypothetical protein
MISSSIFEVEIGSSALHGSSKRIIVGLTARVLAMQSLYCCPPFSEKTGDLSLDDVSSHSAAD